MYLQHQPGTTYPDGDPFAPTNVGDEADTVYHEYTHGLSNRLVVDADGRLDARRRAGRRDGRGAGATGTRWTTWSTRASSRTPRPTATSSCSSTTARASRSTAPSRSTARSAPRRRAARHRRRRPAAATPTATTARSIGFPEVHADGEIWAQTLWDLRDGARLATDRVAGDPRDGALAVQPVVPRRAQRDPAGRPGDLRRPARTTHLAGVRAPRHGLLRRRARRRRLHAGRGLLAAAARRDADRHPRGRRDGRRHRCRRSRARPWSWPPRRPAAATRARRPTRPATT